MNSKTTEIESDEFAGSWSRIEELFDQASQLPAAEQQVFLKKIRDEESDVYAYLCDLLNADPEINAGIEKTIVDTMSLAFADENTREEELRGQMVGPYRIVRMIGAGGMGMVYLAERADEQYDQQVAIKLGKHRLVDPNTEERLRSERQILANLDHPNIARLLDGGTSHDGVPYLVMEYIDGVRIDTYCDRHSLNVTERLKLLQTICAAVHYAHQNLIIHRDIKASNILVTEDGVPKLLDFGIAKLADTQGAATDGLTREGMIILTPENAAPEQVLGKTITTATDTYAIGLLAHLLLTGFRTYSMEDVSPTEYARIICDADPPAPSVRLGREVEQANRTQDAQALAEIRDIAASRGSTIERLQRQLRGDIDTIVLNALRTEPDRRYRSTNALSDDISLHLRSMPIVARADSWKYRTGKFLRRHYAAVGAAAVGVAMLATFAIVVSLQNERILQERDKARAVASFLEETFTATDPVVARGEETTARELLERGAARIDSDLEGNAEIKATLMGTIGRVYHGLGLYGSSRQILEDSLSLRRSIYPESHDEVTEAKEDLVETLAKQAEFQRAEDLIRSALEANRKAHGDDSPRVALNYSDLASIQFLAGNTESGTRNVKQSIALFESLPPQMMEEDNQKRRKQLASTRALYGRMLHTIGDLGGAEDQYRAAIDLVDEDPDHPSTAYFFQNLGVVQHARGDLDEAGDSLARAIGYARRVLRENQQLHAAILRDQGQVYQSKGNLAQAEILMQRSLDTYVEAMGIDHPDVGFTSTVFGRLLHDLGELARAEQALRQALLIYNAALGPENQYSASALTELAAVLNSAGRSAEALPLAQRAIDIRSTNYRKTDELYAATQTEFADTLSRLGRFEEAQPLLIDSQDVLRDTPGRRRDRANQALARFHDLVQQSADSSNAR